MSSEKILLLDGNSLAYRAFFALPLLTNEHGIHTNAVYGFTMMLQKIMDEENPTHMLVAFDAGKLPSAIPLLKNIREEDRKLHPSFQSNFHIYASL